MPTRPLVPAHKVGVAVCALVETTRLPLACVVAVGDAVANWTQAVLDLYDSSVRIGTRAGRDVVMPDIGLYIERAGSTRYYDEDDLALLQLVYDRLCVELAIPVENKPRRETIALLLFQFFERVKTPHNLQKSVLDAMRTSS